MESKEHITNEELRKKFKNQFELVNYAIKLAENMIYTGREARTESGLENRAMQVLEEITSGKDKFVEIPAVLAVEAVEVKHDTGHREGKRKAMSFEAMTKMSPPKKHRKILLDA